MRPVALYYSAFHCLKKNGDQDFVLWFLDVFVFAGIQCDKAFFLEQSIKYITVLRVRFHARRGDEVPDARCAGSIINKRFYCIYEPQELHECEYRPPGKNGVRLKHDARAAIAEAG